MKDGALFRGGDPPFSLMIYHSSYEPASANTWIEITHRQVPTELKGMWCWRMRGSGVWFNTGNTRTFPGHAEAGIFLQTGCSAKVHWAWPRQESDLYGSCAREKGYESIQFEPQSLTPLSTWGAPGMTELVITGLDGQNNCGTADGSKTTLRSGWMASQQCDCETLEAPPRCGISTRAPMFPYFGYSDPPLCAAQTGVHFWVPCDPSECKPTACKLPSKIVSQETVVEIHE